jgi:hypothetical protein
MKQCHKKRFDKIGALWALTQAKRSTDKRRKEKRMYFCTQCKAYHLTKQEKIP